MIDKYLDRLVIPEDFLSYGYCALNDDMGGRIIEDVIEISFNSLYKDLLIYFYDNGVLDRFIPDSFKVSDDIISKLRVSVDRFWINSIWGRELRNVVYILFDLFNQYMRMYYKDVCDYTSDWLYIDVDSIFIKKCDMDINKMMNDVSFLVCGYNVEYRPFVYFESRKRYVVVDKDMIIKDRAFGSRYSKSREDIVSNIRCCIREKKLVEILG
jgi:hypothetical protein